MKQVQFRGGTQEEHLSGNNGAGFTGLAREVTVDTTNWSLRVHDGITVGGFMLLKASDAYTKDEIDQRIVDIVSGGSISLNGYATVAQLNQKAESVHTHSGYSQSNHKHDTYSSIDHLHISQEITFEDGETLEYKFQNSKLANVNMDDYVKTADFNIHTHNEYANASHEHIEYSQSNHNHNSNYSPLLHLHSEYITTELFNEIILSVAQKDHEHAANNIFINNVNLYDFITQFKNSFDSHNHDSSYYSKVQVDEFIEDTRLKSFDTSIGYDEWILNQNDLSYYTPVIHNLNTLFVNAIGVSDRGLEVLDVKHISEQEIYIINEVNINMDIRITAI